MSIIVQIIMTLADFAQVLSKRRSGGYTITRHQAVLPDTRQGLTFSSLELHLVLPSLYVNYKRLGMPSCLEAGI